MEEKIENLNENNIELKEIDVNIKKRENEKFYFKSYVTLIKSIEKEIDYGSIVGTPVKVFGQTVFIGGGGKEKKKVEELSAVDKGEFYISNKRILFIGEKKKYDIDLDSLISYSFNMEENTLKISSKKLGDILFFKFNNGLESPKVFLIINILNKQKQK